MQTNPSLTQISLSVFLPLIIMIDRNDDDYDGHDDGDGNDDDDGKDDDGNDDDDDDKDDDGNA